MRMSDGSSDVCSSDLPKAPREEARDRAGGIDCVIDFAAARIGRDDDRGNTRPGPPAIPFGWRDMVPPPAIFVEGDDDEHFFPLRAVAQCVDHTRDMAVAGIDIRIACMHVEAIGRESCRERVCEYVSISVVAV